MIAVDRSVLVRAPRDVVFDFFADPSRFASWFGRGSTIDPRVGGDVRISFPGGASAVGEVVRCTPPDEIAFTWGYPGDDSPLPVGASTVTVTLAEHPSGTLVRLTHELPSDALREAHVAGWRHHLSHLAALAADERRDDLERAAAAWMRLWARDTTDRDDLVASALAPDVEVLDTLATLSGVDDVLGHVTNAHEHLPGVSWAADDDLRTVGDRATWGWRMTHDDHGVVGTGRTSVRVDLDGRITEVVGWWDDHPDDVARRVHGVDDGTEGAIATGPQGDHPAPVEPHLWTRDVPATAAWYEQVLGCEVEARHPADGHPTWARLRRGTMTMMLAAPPAAPPSGTQGYTAAVTDRLDHGGPIALYLAVADVDAAHDRAVAAGATVVEPLWDPWWGGRQCTLQAPDGVWWTLRADDATG